MSRMRKKEDMPGPSAPFWMVTFADMVTLLLTFFVLIVSISAIESIKFRGAMESLRGALGLMAGHESPQQMHYTKFGAGGLAANMDLILKSRMIEEIIKEKGLDDHAQVIVTEGGIKLHLGDPVLFDLGKAVLKPQAHPILSAIADIIKGSSKEIYVEGHTDDIPISTEKYPSNWELSAARAMSVVRYFHSVEGIPERQLAAVGHGEYRPLVPNISSKNRARNRRVEIFIKMSD